MTAPIISAPPGGGDALLRPFADFHSAASALLHCLHQQLGVELSAVTRKSGDDTWLALSVIERTGFYEIQPGTSWPWSDSICARMVERRGPNFAPQLQLVPSYCEVSYASTVGA